MKKNKNSLNRQLGFTLIELLVVVSIIGTLSTIALTSLNGARAKARDARRYSDMNEIRNALELYHADHGNYPSTGGVEVCLGIPSGEKCWDGTYVGEYDALEGNTNINEVLAPYLSEIPKDPLYSKRGYGTYIYRSPGYCSYCGGTSSGAYSISFVPDKYPSETGCGGWTYGAWDFAAHCHGGSCRQCGYLKES